MRYENKKTFLESSIFIIPALLDDCSISYQDLEKIQYVDLYPDWDEGFQKILNSLNISNLAKKDNGIDNNISSSSSSSNSSISKVREKAANSVENLELKLSAYKSITTPIFKGEKQFFFGRDEYINEIIKEKVKNHSSRVCIIGPGGSGKSQLAFKAMHRYEKEGLFDIEIPVYFSDVGLMSLSEFLFHIANSLLLMDVNKLNEFGKQI